MTSRVPLGCVDESELIVEDKVATSLGQKLENLDEAFRRIIIGLREWSVTESLSAQLIAYLQLARNHDQDATLLT